MPPLSSDEKSEVRELTRGIAELVTEFRRFGPVFEHQVTGMANHENRITKVEEKAAMNLDKINDFKNEYEKDREADKSAFRFLIQTLIGGFAVLVAMLGFAMAYLVNK